VGVAACRRPPGHDAEIDFGLADLCLLVGDANVAGLDEFTATAEGVAVDAGDNRDRTVVDALVYPRALARLALCQHIAFAQLLDVGARDEGTGVFRTRQDDDANVTLLDGVEDILQFRTELGVERVACVRPAQFDRRHVLDPVADGGVDRLTPGSSVLDGHQTSPQSPLVPTMSPSSQT